MSRGSSNKTTMKRQRPRRIGPYSKAGALARLDGRSPQAQYLKRVTRELVAHVGGNPSAVQQMLIDRAARLSLQLELMDERQNNDVEFSERNGRQYMCWSNGLTRTLAKLGAPKTKPTVKARPMVENDIVFSFSSTATPSEPRPKSKAKATSSDFDPEVGLGASYTEQYTDQIRKKNKARRPSPKSAEAGSFQTSVVSR